MAFSRKLLHWLGDKKLSLPYVWSSVCSWGYQNHCYKGAALSIKLMESLLCPPSKEMVPPHMLTSLWIQTDPAVKQRTLYTNNEWRCCSLGAILLSW